MAQHICNIFYLLKKFIVAFVLTEMLKQMETTVRKIETSHGFKSMVWNLGCPSKYTNLVLFDHF